MGARPGLTADPITARLRATSSTAPRPLPKVPEWERIVTEMQTVAELFVRGEYHHRRGGRARWTAAPTGCSKSAAG